MPLVVTVSLQDPVESASANPSVAVGTNAGVVLRYGNWSDTSEPGCYKPDSLWAPGATTLYATVAFANTSASASDSAAAVTATTADTSVPIGVHVYSSDVWTPVPGGCSTTGQTINDPTLLLSYNDGATAVDFQQSDVGMPRVFQVPARHACSCDFVVAAEAEQGGTLQYELFRAFVSDCGSKLHHNLDAAPLYTALGRMSTVAGVKRYGVKHPTKALMPSDAKRVVLGSVPGQVRTEGGETREVWGEKGGGLETKKTGDQESS